MLTEFSLLGLLVENLLLIVLLLIFTPVYLFILVRMATAAKYSAMLDTFRKANQSHSTGVNDGEK